MNAQNERKFRTNPPLMAALAVAALYVPAALAQQNTRNQTVFAGVLDSHEHLNAAFQVNRDLGRAWVAVELTPDAPAGYPETGETQVMPRSVDGLSYDKATKQVVYKSGKVQAVCAEDSTFLWDKSVKPTGQCPLRVSVQTRVVDDGFNPHQEKFGQVILQLPTSNASAVSER